MSCSGTMLAINSTITVPLPIREEIHQFMSSTCRLLILNHHMNPLFLCLIYLILQRGKVVYIGFDESLPLWMLSTQDVGGLGWDTKDIGEVSR